MTRRKREIIGLRNERDFPYLVELAIPTGGSIFLEIDAFHRERRIPVAAAEVATRSSHSIFDSASQTPPPRMHSAIASVARCLTYAPDKPKPRTSERRRMQQR
jgi:hypothetical protein